MLGLYVGRDSPVHALPAGVKLAGLIVAVAAVLAAPGWWGAGAMALAGTALALLARLPLGVLASQMRPVVVMLVLLFTAQSLLAGTSWQEGLSAALRFIVLVLVASVVTMTTRVSDMVEAFERALSLLRPLGVDPAKLALMLALVIRLVPVLIEQVHEIRMAQKARGVERNPAALFVPLLIKVFAMADDLSAALDARGYDSADAIGRRDRARAKSDSDC